MNKNNQNEPKDPYMEHEQNSLIRNYFLLAFYSKYDNTNTNVCLVNKYCIFALCQRFDMFVLYNTVTGWGRVCNEKTES